MTDTSMKALLDAIKVADKVKRPVADLKVGDRVIVRGGHRGTAVETVEAIGRTWIKVSGVKFGFRRTNLRTARGAGPEWWLVTPEQDEYDSRLHEARERLRWAGIALSSWQSLPDGRVLAVAALLELLDAERQGPVGGTFQA